MGVSTSPFSSRIPSDADLCRPCVCCLSLCKFICPSILLIQRALVFLVSSGSCTFSISSSAGFFKPGGEGFDGDILFKAECSKLSHPPNIVCLWVFFFVPICCRRSKAPVCEYTECPQESFYRYILYDCLVLFF